MIVNVGSKNHFKVEAVKEALSKIGYEAKVCSFKTTSRVPAQPIGEDTFIGAKNRALAVISDKSDFTIGIESGIVKRDKVYFDFAVVHVISRDKKESYATTSYFALPENIAQLIEKGYELSDAIDKEYKIKNSKKNISAVGVLTDGKINLKNILVDTIVLAMYPFFNEKLKRD